jgi:hypothetical protein
LGPGQILSIRVNVLPVAPLKMNLTSLFSHAYRGVKLPGVVETELEL